MHIRGRIDLQREGAARDPGALELVYSDSVTVLETEAHRIVYEGVIFDATDEQIRADPRLLDGAFGYYTYVVLEKHGGRLLIGTDRLGFSPVYFSNSGSVFRFSSSICLLKCELDSVTPNMDAWDEILTLGDILGEKTVIREIERLQWGRKLSIEHGRVSIIGIWDPEVPSYCDRKTYIERNNGLLLEAIRLTGAGNRERIVALTGGQDSRRLAAAMRREGIPMSCATQEILGSDNKDEDILIAQEVARCLGVRHTPVAVPPPQVLLSDSSLKDRWSGYESGYHAWAVNLMRQLPRGSLVYDGIGGDVTVNGHYFRAHPEAITRYDDLDYLARAICGGARSYIDPRALSSPLQDRVKAELARFPSSPHRLTYFFLLNHTRRNIGSWYSAFGLFGHLPSTPYLYHPLLLQSLTLEPTLYLGEWMQNECLRVMNAPLAQIPSTRDPVPHRYLKDMSGLTLGYSNVGKPGTAAPRKAVRYLPGLATRHYAHTIASRLGLAGFGHRWLWASSRVQRFSDFLDWLDEKEPPTLPEDQVAPRSPRGER